MPGRTVKSETAAARVKQEKVRRARAAAEEQHPTTQGNVNGTYHEDQYAQNEENNESDDVRESPRGSKRSRVNEEGDARPSPAPDGSQASEVGPSEYRERAKTQPRDEDGFIPGSIVRIQLRNFVTYDYVEFRPGPYLNMILGPNGTGKSSIACAICLGLNWPPSVLGRAAELNSFVKNGTEDGHIEIELKGSIGKPNLVIRRNLKANSKGSSFTLNGHAASGREINNKMAELNVQVGNLCSFLPQDKVSEFAAMSPQQLLRETQRAAGDERLTQWHDTLISAGKELKQLQELMTNEREQLKVMEERNQGLERDVQRFNERKKIEHDIELLQILVPVQEYREKRVQCLEAKKVQRELHEKVVKLKAKNAPAHALLKTLESQYKELETERDGAKGTIRERFGKMKNKWDKSEELDTKMEDLTLRLDRLKTEEKERIKKIKRLEVELERMKADLETKLEVEDTETVNSEIRQLNMERQDVSLRAGAAKEKIQRIVDQKASHKAEVDRRNNELRSLDNVDNQKLQMLQRWDRDHYDALMWLRQNKDRFQMEVIEPPLMCLTVPNKRYLDSVEACFGANQLKTFVAQCQADYDLFNDFMHSKNVLGKKVRINTWFRPQSQIVPPPMSKDEMQQLGFDGYAIDYVECPPGLLFFLQKELNLHRTAIALNGSKVHLQRATDAVARVGPGGGNGGSFIAGVTMHRVARSRYGRRAVQSMAQDIRKARNLGNSSVDHELLNRINSAIAEAQQQIDLLAEQQTDAEREHKEIVEEDKVFRARNDELQARKKAIADAHKARGVLQAKYDRGTRQLVGLQNTPSAEVETKKVRKELLGIAKQRTAIVKEYLGLVRAVSKEQVEVTQLGLQFLQIGANQAALKALCDKKDERYQRAVLEFREADAEFHRLKDESKVVLTESRRLLEAADQEMRDEFEEIEALRNAWEKKYKEAEAQGLPLPTRPAEVEHRTTAELLAELDEQRNKLELNLNTNPGVVEQYERRKQEIEHLTKTLEEKQKKADKIERNIKNARENWKPALDALVSSIGKKFSAAFDRIGCAGEIRISENEDYDKWAIDILVKFRDHEKLQLLTGQRQSGGERSLTTILYLMSLTEEARAPFSLVDEINQGMDQRAERNVHNSMVEVTCKPDSAQYFLITPKLLPDLNYHERMRILCVNNGEWLPDEQGIGNMMSMIEGFVAKRGRAPQSN